MSVIHKSTLRRAPKKLVFGEVIIKNGKLRGTIAHYGKDHDEKTGVVEFDNGRVEVISKRCLENTNGRTKAFITKSYLR